MSKLFTKKNNKKAGFIPTPILKKLSMLLNNLNFLSPFTDQTKGSIGIGVSLRSKRGFTLIEMLIYISLMVIITLVVTQSIIVVLKSNRASFADINIRNSGYSAIEGILREIRSSESIDQVSNSILQMTKSSGNIVRFATSSDLALNFYEGVGTPVLIGPITSKNILVKNLNFRKIDTGKSLAVKIEIELETTVNGITKNEWFYNTAILRGSY